MNPQLYGQRFLAFIRDHLVTLPASQVRLLLQDTDQIFERLC